MVSELPTAVDVNVRVASFTKIVELIASPDHGRSGVTKYSYSGTVNCSTYSFDGPVSKSYTVIESSARDGNTTVSFI